MLIAQITDVHIGFDPDDVDEFNRQRLDHLLAHIADGPTAPAALIISGDMADRGDAPSYATLAAVLTATGWPLLPCVGNHDLRDVFDQHFPGHRDANGFIQYVRDMGPLRLIVIDTLEEGRHGGAFCERRAAWLRERLAERPDLPTWIVMHHPPVDSGIEWMTTDQREPWVERFATAISDASHLGGLICGHLHRSVTVPWRGLTVAICSSVAPQVALDLRPIHADTPDQRPMIVAEDPAYALHHWNGSALVSYFERAGSRQTLATFDERMQPLVRELVGERPV
jgi:3',5'-cyclic AMP phosphodiesterase CpdA